MPVTDGGDRSEYRAGAAAAVQSDDSWETLMTVTNTATDSDIPANLLTYSLLVKPIGATIDTTV